MTYEGKEYPRRIQLRSLMKRQLAALVHCVRRTALMRVTDMTGTMTKRIAGGIINASIIMKNMPCHNRKHSRYGKNKKRTAGYPEP